MQHRLQELCDESVPISCRSCAVRRSAGAAHVGSPRDANPPHGACRPHEPSRPHARRPRPHDPACVGPGPRRRIVGLVAVARPRRGHPRVRPGPAVRSRSPSRGGPRRSAGRTGPRSVRGCGRVRGRGRLRRPCRHASLRFLARDPPAARDDHHPPRRRGPGGRTAGHGRRNERAPGPALRRPPGRRTVRLRRSAALPRTRCGTDPAARPSPTPNPDPEPSATTPTVRPPPSRRPTPRHRAPSHRRPPPGHRRAPARGFESGFGSRRSVAGVGGAGAGAGGPWGSVARRQARPSGMGAGGEAATGTLTR
jgi:hypothetical protein